MIVFAVLGHYYYEGDDLIIITTDRERAVKAREDAAKGYYDSVRIEEWNAATGTEITSSVYT